MCKCCVMCTPIIVNKNMQFFVFLCILIKTFFVEATCPSLCVCKTSRPNETTTADSAELIKFKCGGSENPISEIKEIDFSEVSMIVMNLNLSGNMISTLSRELNLSSLQKLDLSKNQISLIETDAFYNLGNLQRLDLSENLIQTVYKEIFKGLLNLERLVLAQNRIQNLAAGTFEYLSGMKQLDLSGNPFKCDCNLVWLGDWARDSNVKLGNPKCGSPETTTGQPVRKLKLFIEPASCNGVSGLPFNALVIKPYHTQIVFEGDSLVLKCRAPFTPLNSVYELKWSHPKTLLNASELVITNVDVTHEGLAEATMLLPRIASNHSGNWSCIYTQGDNTDISLQLELVVITTSTRYCPAEATVDNRGELFWPQALQGHVVRQPCGGATAVRVCDDSGTWRNLNTSACPYSSETTKMLQQFALLNMTRSKGTVLAAAHRLSSLVELNVPPAGALHDADDVHFVARAINNYLQYAHQEDELGLTLLDIVSLMLHLPHSVMLQAERQFSACTALVLAAEEISKYMGGAQNHKKDIALERLSVRRASFTGVTCVWYGDTHTDTDPRAEGTRSASASRVETRQLHCSSTNSTIGPFLSSRHNIISSIQIPPSLLYRMDNNIDTSLSAMNAVYSLVVAMYSSAALFPVLPRHEGGELTHRTKDYYGYSTKRDDMNMEITSPVVGVNLVNVSLQQPLAEPVYIMVRSAGVSSGVEGRAVMWDEHERKWNDATDTSCSVSHIVADMVVIRCFQLGYVGLLQSVENGFYGTRTSGARFKVSHPAVYVGAIVLILCLSTNVLTYTLCYSAIQMCERTKHALINSWISVGALCFIYTLGIYQTENLKLCQMLGLTIHYFSLSSLLWMVVSASLIYKSVSKNYNSNSTTPNDDVNADSTIARPILGVYLVGWGIALIVCGISAAVNLRDYASYSQCFLSTAPSLNALFVPAGILATFLVFMYLSIRCTIGDVVRQPSEGTQATENGDLELWEASVVGNDDETDGASVGSASGAVSEAGDAEHAPAVQLRALVIVLTLYVSVWMCAAVTVYRPFPSYLPYQEDIFSIIYALCSTFLGTFILFFYGIARSDVRAQWLTMQCTTEKSGRCSSEDDIVLHTESQQNLHTRNRLARTATRTIGESRSRSSSRASNVTNSTNKNNEMSKAAELNAQMLRRATLHTNTADEVSNTHSVSLHRDRSTSNRTVSALEHPQNGQCVDVYYNPNQSNVARKFFKKQKQSMKRVRACLEIPNSRDCGSQSCQSLPLFSRRSFIGTAHTPNSAPKVKNNYTGMEKLQQSNGNQEIEHSTNPNSSIQRNEPILNVHTYKEYNELHENLKPKSDSTDDAKYEICNSLNMNIYTNIAGTRVPQPPSGGVAGSHCVTNERCTISELCLPCRAHNEPPVTSVSQQCSLQYSSDSDMDNNSKYPRCSPSRTTPHSTDVRRPHTHAPCSTNGMGTDTESPSRYVEYLQPSRIAHHFEGSNEKLINDGNSLDESLQHILSEECISNGNDVPTNIDHTEMSELVKIIHMKQSDHKNIDCLRGTLDEQKKHHHLRQNAYEFVSSSMNASEQAFDNDRDVYYPTDLVSEVSIRSHGSYAPRPPSICPDEMSMAHSNEDVSNSDIQYVNFNPTWRKNKINKSESVSSPVSTCREENGDRSSPASLVSELELLYTEISNSRTPRVSQSDDANSYSTIDSNVTLKITQLDSCV